MENWELILRERLEKELENKIYHVDIISSNSIDGGIGYVNKQGMIEKLVSEERRKRN